MTKTLVDQFLNVRRVSTPLVAVRTTDPAAVAAIITTAVGDVPVVQWDASAGFQPRNKKGADAIVRMCGTQKDANLVLNPADAFFMLGKMEAGSVVLAYNAHKVWSDLTTLQSIWNLRDQLKANNRTFVLFATPEARVVRELESDVIVLDDPLPNDEQLAAVITQSCKNAKLPEPDADSMRKAIDAIRGLSMFVAEQVVALSLTRKGINITELRERKIQAVEQTPGAKIYRGKERFASIGGHDGLKKDLAREIRSRKPVKLVVILDEFEKMSAGAAGDNTGVSQDQQQQFLTFMQDHDVRGSILYGHPGAGKTLAAKAMANEADCLCIMADMGAMKASHVGDSEARVRAFMSMVLAIAGDGGAYFVATCNSTGAITPEMRRRFKSGFYFVDLPTRAEKDAIWSIHTTRLELPKQERPDDSQWTGAEIESCCEKAWNYGISLKEAAKSIVSVAKASPELIEARRKEADGRILSAQTGETYVKGESGTKGGDIDLTGKWVSPVTVRQVAEMPES